MRRVRRQAAWGATAGSAIRRGCGGRGRETPGAPPRQAARPRGRTWKRAWRGVALRSRRPGRQHGDCERRSDSGVASTNPPAGRSGARRSSAASIGGVAHRWHRRACKRRAAERRRWGKRRATRGLRTQCIRVRRTTAQIGSASRRAPCEPATRRCAPQCCDPAACATGSGHCVIVRPPGTSARSRAGVAGR